ncbi:TIM-barrel domain-containing protein [Cellulomonas sp. Marseille-Q8402]
MTEQPAPTETTETADEGAQVASADPAAVVTGPGYRITVLTSRLLRLEHQADGDFEDRPTQLVRRRRLPVPELTVRRDDDGLDLWTEHLHVRYDGGPFTPSGLSVTMRTRAQGGHRTQWRFGDPAEGVGGSNLGGTARTLDDVDGATDLGAGLLSRDGFAVVDDSPSLALDGAGRPVPRAGVGQDLYFLGYGTDHRAALRAWFTLTGPSPLVPRWALGNWWSRFHRYDEAEYLALMDRFAAAGVPLSVAVLDMDWHLVDIDPALGSGWTGYTWNTDLFPDPAAFLAELHRRGLRVAVNVHPADGVRAHEDAYADVARDLGLDPADGLPIAFDITDAAFTESYLRRLHHPHEEIGVDLWWLDWQSGQTSRVPGLDPLWMLNDVHYRDSGRGGRRPLTFSRYAGLGSHRQPIGFSGDTYATWESLAFQPEFTATAANVGYFWWSHDIGGHFGATFDPELMVRWFQLGALSPVNRLHSSSDEFVAKEPWRFDPVAERAMTRALRARHALVPYLYSAMWAAHTDGVGPVRPMYHDHPEQPEAYDVPGQYLLGPDLLVAPVTTPVEPGSGLAATDVWLPAGDWYDAVTGRRYRGGRRVRLHRRLDGVPVLARAGAVLPLATDPMADVSDAPEALTVRIYPGTAGEATLVEDDGGAAPEPQTTRISWSATGTGDVEVTVDPPTGPGVRTRRRLRVELVGLVPTPASAATPGAGSPAVAVEALPAPEGTSNRDDVPPAGAVVDLGEVDLATGLRLEVSGLEVPRRDLAREVADLLDPMRIPVAQKNRALAAARSTEPELLPAAWHALGLPGTVLGALLELLG